MGRVRKRMLGKKSECKGPGVGGSIVNSKKISITKAKRTTHGNSLAETREDLRSLSQR